MITLNIAGGPEKVKKPWLVVYYKHPIDIPKDQVIRKLVSHGRFIGSGTDFKRRDNAFEFDHPSHATIKGKQLKRMKLIDSFEVRI